MSAKPFNMKNAYVDEDMTLMHVGNYGDGTPAILIYDENGEEYAVATVCMAGYGEKPQDGHVFIKTWSENEGVLESLVAAEVVSPPVRWVDAGYCKAAEVKIL